MSAGNWDSGHKYSGSQLGGKQQVCEITSPVMPLPRRKTLNNVRIIKGMVIHYIPFYMIIYLLLLI